MPRYFVLFLLFVGACTPATPSSTPTPTPTPTQASLARLTEAEIHAELVRLTTSKEEAAPTPNAEAVKAKGIIPLKTFFPSTEMQKLKYAHWTKYVEAAPASVDLTSRDSPIKNQTTYPYCTAFAGVGAMENILNGMQKTGWDLSEWDAFFKYNQYSCTGFINALTSLSNRICDEADYPTGGKRALSCDKNSHAMIAQAKYLNNDFAALKNEMALGHVGYVGMQVPSDMVNCKKVISPNSTMIDGGHALAIVKYWTDPTFGDMWLLKNSWGSACADHGYMAYPVSLCTKAGSYCQVWSINLVDSTKLKPTPTVVPTIKPTVKPTAAPTVKPLTPFCNDLSKIIKDYCPGK